MEKYIKQLEKEILDFQTDWNNGSAVMEVSYALNDNELNIIAKINNKSFSFYVCNGISKTAILERAINTIGIIGLNKLYTDKIKGLRTASLTFPLIKDVDRKNIAKFPLTYDEVFELASLPKSNGDESYHVAGYSTIIPKYYTPELDEFYIGFEYEIMIPEKEMWSKEIFYLNKSHIDLIQYVDIQDEFTKKKIRVKYLDKEDIEILGFKHIGAFWFEKGDIKIRKWKKLAVDIYFNLHRKMEGEPQSEFRVFKGDIKNKSELIKVLKQTCDYETI